MNNSVELIGHYGSDEIIALSAWTSTSRELPDEKRERIPNMIKTLWSDGHETPFEKGIVHFLVNTDIATHIHLLKHRISSMNGESARYKEIKEDKVYIPQDWVMRNEGDPRSVSTETISTTWDYFDFDVSYDDWAQILEKYSALSNHLYHSALRDLTPILGRKRAKESARFFKAYNSQIQGDVSFNMRSFANFLKLRNSEHAQLEIRELAQKMLELVKNIDNKPFKHTLEAWGYAS